MNQPRRRIRNLGLLIPMLALISLNAIAGDDALVKIHLDPKSVVGHVPEDFMGLGYETSAVAQPDFFSPKNLRMIHLYRNLSQHGLIRIGGNVSDHTRYLPNGTASPQTERSVTVINQASLSDLGEFCRATGWSVMWGLNLGTGSKEEAVEEAVAVDKALGSSLQSFEIGNEVDLMRKYANNYDAYHAAFLEYKAAIRQRLPNAAFSGPDSAGNFSFCERFAATEAADLKYITHHYYRGGAGDPKSTIDLLLAGDENVDHQLDQLQHLCADHKLAYRINEVNSFYGGGKKDVSDTFASALWCLDYMFDLASHGCGGVNIETDINQLGFISHYSPIVHDDAGVCTARPEYYGMLAFALAGHGELLKRELTKSDVNLTAYATREENGTVWVTIINKDASHDPTVEVTVPSRFGPAQPIWLRAPMLDSKSGVLLGNAAVTDDGTWTPNAAEPIVVREGVVHLKVSRASAVLLKFPAASKSQ